MKDPEKLTVEYRTYLGFMGRCYKPNNQSWRHYGGRGIVVCKRWRDSYDTFLEDVGRRPKGDYSLDRINNNGPYAPENVRWATREQQQKNRRSRKYITYHGVTLPLVTGS